MPTENPRITITMSEEQLKQINNYRFGNKMKNQTQAILSLISRGFEEIERQQSEKGNDIRKRIDCAASIDEMDDNIRKYRALDTYGQNTVLAVLDCEYTRCVESISIQNTAKKIVPLPDALKAILPNVAGLDYDDDPKTIIKRFAGRDGVLTEWAISEKQAAQLKSLMKKADREDASECL